VKWFEVQRQTRRPVARQGTSPYRKKRLSRRSSNSAVSAGEQKESSALCRSSIWGRRLNLSSFPASSYTTLQNATRTVAKLFSCCGHILNLNDLKELRVNTTTFWIIFQTAGIPIRVEKPCGIATHSLRNRSLNHLDQKHDDNQCSKCTTQK
jgi:hypothetical protein